MTSSVIRLSGIRASGRHGANPGERLEAQAFVVDLEVTVEVGEDSLDATIDYGVLAEAARQAVGQGSFELLESLADAVARAVFQYEPVRQVVAVVHKPGAARALGLDDVSADAVVS